MLVVVLRCNRSLAWRDKHVPLAVHDQISHDDIRSRAGGKEARSCKHTAAHGRSRRIVSIAAAQQHITARTGKGRDSQHVCDAPSKGD